MSGSEAIVEENAETATEEEEKLCRACEGFHFEAVGKSVSFSEFELRRPFWYRREPGGKIKCPLCRQLRKYWDKWMEQEKRFRLEDVEPRGGKYCDVDISVVLGLVGQMIVVFRVRTRVQEWYHQVEFWRCMSKKPPEVEELIARSPPEFGTADHMFYGRIRPKLAKMELFLEWKKRCTENGRCDGIGIPRTVDLSTIRLIDVDKLSVVERMFEQDINYVALSYVWGVKTYSNDPEKWSSFKHSFESGNQFRSLREKDLPATISDAILMTKALGVEYLWVDSICIIQDDNDDKQKYIPYMDSIYGMASVTIVAATGVNPQAGLRGLRPGTRKLDPRPFTIKGVTLLQSVGLPERRWQLSMDPFDECIWSDRGWTLQEKTFSTRRLVFTEELVYWECKCGLWSEETMMENGDHGNSLLQDDLLEGVENMLNRTILRSRYIRPFRKVTFVSVYMSLAAEYTKRGLSLQEDGLNAFRGVLTALETDTCHSFFWALPAQILSNALAWHFDIQSKSERRKLETTTCFAQGSSFPSWSWVGWVGCVVWSLNGNGVSYYRFGKDSKMMFRGHINHDVDRAVFIFFYRYVEGSLEKLEPAESLPTKDGPLYLNPKHEVGLKQDVGVEYIGGRLRENIGLLSNILFFWTSSVELQVKWLQQQDWTLHQEGTNLLKRMIWCQRPPLCDRQEKVFQCIVIGSRMLEGKKKIEDFDGRFVPNCKGVHSTEDHKYLIQIVGGEGESEAGDDMSYEGAIMEYLTVLLLSPMDGYGVQYREGLVLIKLEQWHNLKRREWKLIRLG